jgi:hypothetical protein
MDTAFLDTLVKLANLGTSGICVLAIAWGGYQFQKIPNDAPPIRYETLKSFFNLCILIAITSAVTGLLSAYFNRQQIVTERSRANAAVAEMRQARERDREELAKEKKRIYEQVYQAAVEQYANSLGKLIGKAKGDVDDNLSLERIEVSARAFVGARNELRETLTNLSGSLNHEVDELEDASKELQKNPNDKAAQDRVRKAILVIAQKWPVKADAVKVQIRKLLAELGLERILRGE